MKRKTVAEERPDLVSQWDAENTYPPDKVLCGSHLKVLWNCPKGHTWSAEVKNRVLLGSGCPYCKHRAVLRGYNDLLTTNPELMTTWSNKNIVKPYEVLPSSNREVIWECSKGHEWKARIADRTRGHGCPYCSGNKDIKNK